MTGTRDLADNWRKGAKCAGRDWSWWDLIGGETAGAEGKLTVANEAAIDICAGCPVARQCFDEALAAGDRGVIRGGIALFKPMERYRCVLATCRKVRLRPVSQKGHGREYCGEQCRNAARSAATRRRLVAVAA